MTKPNSNEQSAALAVPTGSAINAEWHAELVRTADDLLSEVRELRALCGAIAIVIKEQLDKAEMWEKHYKADPQGRIDEAFWKGRARALGEVLHYVQSHLPNNVLGATDLMDKRAP